MGAILFLAALVVLLIVFGVGMLLQERRPVENAVVYSVEDALDFVWEHLDEGTRSTVGRSDVRRILEWEMHYLQQPAKRTGAAVVGGTEAAAYAQDRSAEQGYGYEPETIFAVLEQQVRYLAALGAVGSPADPAE
jgi:hypothetical protein